MLDNQKGESAMKKLPFYRDTFFSRLIVSYTALAVVLLGLAGDICIRRRTG